MLHSGAQSCLWSTAASRGVPLARDMVTDEHREPSLASQTSVKALTEYHARGKIAFCCNVLDVDLIHCD